MDNPRATRQEVLVRAHAPIQRWSLAFFNHTQSSASLAKSSKATTHSLTATAMGSGQGGNLSRMSSDKRFSHCTWDLNITRG